MIQLYEKSQELQFEKFKSQKLDLENSVQVNQYERRVNNLSKAMIFWKNKVASISEKCVKAINVLKTAKFELKGNYDENIKELKKEYSKDIEKIKLKLASVK